MMVEMDATDRLDVAWRAARVPAFHAMAMSARAGEMERAGHDVLRLELGQPATGAPAGARRAVIAALEAEQTLGYTDAPGRDDLIERIARHYDESYGIRVQSADVDPSRRDLFVGYEEALAAFDAGDFRRTARILGNLLERFPGDGPALVLLSRAVGFMVNEPRDFSPVWQLPGK